METRLERNKKLKGRKRIKKFKLIFIFILFGFMVLGLTVVNENIIELQCLDNPTIFNFDYKTRKLDLLGKTYLIDLKILKEID